MSWAEVKKINSDLSTPLDARIDAKTLKINSSTTKPLDTLIGEKTTEIKNSISAKSVNLISTVNLWPSCIMYPGYRKEITIYNNNQDYYIINISGQKGILLEPYIEFKANGSGGSNYYSCKVVIDGVELFSGNFDSAGGTAQFNRLNCYCSFTNSLAISVRRTSSSNPLNAVAMFDGGGLILFG